MGNGVGIKVVHIVQQPLQTVCAQFVLVLFDPVQTLRLNIAIGIGDILVKQSAASMGHAGHVVLHHDFLRIEVARSEFVFAFGGSSSIPAACNSEHQPRSPAGKIRG